jgi:hypothetical protein
MTMNNQFDPYQARENDMLDMETAHTIGAVAIAIINALGDEGYNAAVETLHRYAGDETCTGKQRSLFGSIVRVLIDTPLTRPSEDNRKRAQPRFEVITGGAA